MIVWFCDVCGCRIADDREHIKNRALVWKMVGSITPMENAENVGKGSSVKEILCNECKEYLMSEIYKTFERAVCRKRNEKR